MGVEAVLAVAWPDREVLCMGSSFLSLRYTSNWWALCP